jgi:hypothetical protein
MNSAPTGIAAPSRAGQRVSGSAGRRVSAAAGQLPIQPGLRGLWQLTGHEPPAIARNPGRVPPHQRLRISERLQRLRISERLHRLRISERLHRHRLLRLTVPQSHRHVPLQPPMPRPRAAPAARPGSLTGIRRRPRTSRLYLTERLRQPWSGCIKDLVAPQRLGPGRFGPPQPPLNANCTPAPNVQLCSESSRGAVAGRVPPVHRMLGNGRQA